MLFDGCSANCCAESRLLAPTRVGESAAVLSPIVRHKTALNLDKQLPFAQLSLAYTMVTSIIGIELGPLTPCRRSLSSVLTGSLPGFWWPEVIRFPFGRLSGVCPTSRCSPRVSWITLCWQFGYSPVGLVAYLPVRTLVLGTREGGQFLLRSWRDRTSVFTC